MSELALRAMAESLDPISMVQKVTILEDGIRQELAPVEIPVKHYFALNTYAREITIPKGTVLTGKIHKTEQLNILSKGDLSVLTENGVIRVQAPFTVVSPPGTKRAAYAHEECVWTTIHSTPLKDVDQIELEFIAQSEQEYLEFVKTTREVPCLG